MVCLHLVGKKLLKPLILLDKIADKVYGYLPFNLHCRFTIVGVVKPRLGEPSDAEAVGIDTYHSRNIETLNINIPVGERILIPLTQYG